MAQAKRDRLYPWETAALLAAVLLYWWGVVYPPLCPPVQTTVRETAALTGEEACPAPEDGQGYVLRFRVIEWWDEVTRRWE